MNPPTIGARLADLRADACTTSTELGHLAGLASPSHVGMIERDERPNLAARTATAIARVLGTTAEYLVDGIGERPSKATVQAAVQLAREQRALAAPGNVPTPDDAPTRSSKHVGPRLVRDGYTQVEG